MHVFAYTSYSLLYSYLAMTIVVPGNQDLADGRILPISMPAITYVFVSSER